MSDLFSGKPHTVHITKKNRIQIQSKKKRSLFLRISSERIARNFACVSLLVVTLYAVKEAKVPDEDLIYTAANSVVDIPWEETLGKIQFVNAAMPIDFKMPDTYYGTPALFAPDNTPLLHPWNKEEPFISFKSSSAIALTDGKLESIIRQQDNSLSLFFTHEHNYSTIYHNLSNCSLNVGDTISAGQELGATIDHEMIFILNFDGVSIDPYAYLFEPLQP